MNTINCSSHLDLRTKTHKWWRVGQENLKHLLQSSNASQLLAMLIPFWWQHCHFSDNPVRLGRWSRIMKSFCLWFIVTSFRPNKNKWHTYCLTTECAFKPGNEFFDDRKILALFSIKNSLWQIDCRMSAELIMPKVYPQEWSIILHFQWSFPFPQTFPWKQSDH